MATREEIREGIAKFLAVFDGNCLDNWVHYTGHANDLATYLDSQGVVIKHGEGEADLWVEPLIE